MLQDDFIALLWVESPVLQGCTWRVGRNGSSNTCLEATTLLCSIKALLDIKIVLTRSTPYSDPSDRCLWYPRPNLDESGARRIMPRRARKKPRVITEEPIGYALQSRVRVLGVLGAKFIPSPKSHFFLAILGKQHPFHTTEALPANDLSYIHPSTTSTQ